MRHYIMLRLVNFYLTSSLKMSSRIQLDDIQGYDKIVFVDNYFNLYQFKDLI